MSWKLPYLLPTRIAYVLSVVFLGIFLFAFAWYFGHTAFGEFQSIGSTLISRLGTNSTTSDSVELFFDYTDCYILVLALIGLAIFAFVYSQKRGVPVYGY